MDTLSVLEGQRYRYIYVVLDLLEYRLLGRANGTYNEGLWRLQFYWTDVDNLEYSHFFLVSCHPYGGLLMFPLPYILVSWSDLGPLMRLAILTYGTAMNE